MKKLLVIALAIGTIVGCKKKDDSPAQLDVTAANIAGNYAVTGEITTTDGVAINTFDASYPNPCDKQNTYAYSQSGSVIMTDGCTGLAQSDSYTISGNKLIFNGADYTTISSLTANNLELTETDTIKTNPIKIQITATTYTRK
jgi:hypothetical protein